MKHSSFSFSVVLIHWILAVSILFLFLSSWWMLGLPYNEYRVFPFQLHKNIGLTLALLLALMLFVRLRHKPGPVSASTMQPWMYKLAVLCNISLYFLTFLACLSGYLSTSFSGWGTTLWWLVDMPEWGWEDAGLQMFFSEVHFWTCWMLLAVVVLHIGGAMYHAFRCDGVTKRMLHL